jgi:hypothetical protein
MFMYAPGSEAHPPKVLNFLPELNTLHRFLHATLAPRIGDSSTCPQYERNLIQFYVQKKRFSVFDYILQEIISILRVCPHTFVVGQTSGINHVSLVFTFCCMFCVLYILEL